MNIRTLLLPLLLLLLQTASAQNFLTYSLEDGLPQSQVFAAIQDSKGYMWFGTQGGGVCRYDGRFFQTYTDADGLPSSYVNALFEDDRRRIWVGTNLGVAWFDGAKWHNPREGFSEPVTRISRDRTGKLLMTIKNDLVSLDDDGFHLYPIPGFPQRPLVYGLFPSTNGLWIGTNQGACLLGDMLKRLTTRENLPSNLVRAFARDGQGNIWMATPAGIAVVDETRMAVVATHTDALFENAICMQADAEGNMWVGTTDKGLAIWSVRDSAWTQLGERQGFPRNYVCALVRDNSGTMWAATSGGGVARFIARDFKHFDRRDGLVGDRVYAVMEDSKGRIWMSVSQNGLQVLDSTGLHRFTSDSGYLNIKCRTIAEDRLGRIWVGTEGKGIAVFDSSGMHVLNKSKGLPGDWIQKIMPDGSGDMWVATASDGLALVGLSDSNVLSIKKIEIPEGLKRKQIASIQTDKYGYLWYGTPGGKVGWVKNRMAEYDQANGLSGAPVRCMAFDTMGRYIWVGTKGDGVFVADRNGERILFRPLETPRPLSSRNIYLLQFDRAGNLWIGSENGVDKVSFEKQGFSLEKPGFGVKSVEHFGKNEGFLGIETCQDAAICDRAGNLWFGTMNGLMRYVPSNRKYTGTAPVLHFDDISLFYRPLSQTPYAAWADENGGLREGLELSWNDNHLSFEFRAIDLNHPGKVRYRWKLDGADNAEWSPLSTQQSVNFAGLPPGGYNFMIQATSDGVLFTEPLKAPFSIKAPFWQKGWFQVLAVLTLLGLVLSILQIRIRAVRRAEQVKREKLEVQNRLLQLEQKALQLQMNPHFIFNALNSIQSLVGAGDTQAAKQEISAFAALMRSILHNSRKQVISLKEEADTLEQYLRIEQFCQQNKFAFSIMLPENIDPHEIEIPPMMLQPFVENAVIHGISHLNYAGRIEVAFRYDANPASDGINAATSASGVDAGLLECTIRDNGVGREKAMLLRQERKPGHTSVALDVTRERLEALKKGRQYAVLEYEDITNSEGKVAGTQVTVRLPAMVNF